MSIDLQTPFFVASFSPFWGGGRRQRLKMKRGQMMHGEGWGGGGEGEKLETKVSSALDYILASSRNLCP